MTKEWVHTSVTRNGANFFFSIVDWLALVTNINVFVIAIHFGEQCVTSKKRILVCNSSDTDI